MNRKAVWATVVGVLLVVGVAFTVYFVTRGPRGAATPAAVVSEYVDSLAANDRGRLEQIADPGFDSRAEISSRLSRFGGGKLRVTKTEIGHTEADHIKPVQITGMLNGAKFTEELWLSRHNGRWFMVFGPPKNPGGP